jgi:undecaprenyl-diphosphatase
MSSKRAIAAIVALVVGFIVLATRVFTSATESVDLALLQAFRSGQDLSDPLGPAWLERAVVNLSALGSVAVTVLFVAVAALYLVLDHRPRQAILLVAVTSAASIGITVLKMLFGRERPTVVDHIEVVGGLSFPSGHSVIAAVLYPTLGMLIASNLRDRALKVFVFVIAALLALLVGFSRVYLGVHYPSDVLGGWLLGLAFAIAAGMVIARLKEHNVVERPPGEPAANAVGPIP